MRREANTVGRWNGVGGESLPQAFSSLVQSSGLAVGETGQPLVLLGWCQQCRGAVICGAAMLAGSYRWRCGAGAAVSTMLFVSAVRRRGGGVGSGLVSSAVRRRGGDVGDIARVGGAAQGRRCWQSVLSGWY